MGLRGRTEHERVTQGPDGLVRIVLKKPFSDGTVAVDMAPLSLLGRLAASMPPSVMPGFWRPPSPENAGVRTAREPRAGPSGATSARKAAAAPRLVASRRPGQVGFFRYARKSRRNAPS
jgi:hypothetical protein